MPEITIAKDRIRIMPKKTENKTSAPKAEAKKADTPAKSAETPAAAEKKSSSSGGSARPISYFSSVATDDYRDGWDGIFANSKKLKTKTTAKIRTKSKPKSPIVLELTPDELNDDLRAQLEAAFKAKAKKKRLAYDKRAAAGQISWQLTCKLAS